MHNLKLTTVNPQFAVGNLIPLSAGCFPPYSPSFTRQIKGLPMSDVMSEKDPFDAIERDEKEQMERSSPTELRQKLAETKLAELENKRTQREDQQLKEAKELVRKAQQPYRDRSAKNEALIEAHAVLAPTLPKEMLRDEMAKAALDEVENEDAEADDQTLASLKEAVKDANAGYKEATKRHKQIVKYAKQLLSDKGAA